LTSGTGSGAAAAGGKEGLQPLDAVLAQMNVLICDLAMPSADGMKVVAEGVKT